MSLILIPFFIILNFLNKKESKVICKREFEIILLQTQSLSIKPFNYKRLFSFIKNTLKRFAKRLWLKLKPILRIITYLTYICWEIDNFVIKSDIFRRFVRIFLNNYRVTMTTALDLCLDTLCSENTMVLSARRGFLHACIF